MVVKDIPANVTEEAVYGGVMYVLHHGFRHTLKEKIPRVFYIYVYGRFPVGSMLFLLYKCDKCYYISRSDKVPDQHTNFGTFEMMFDPEYPIERETVLVK